MTGPLRVDGDDVVVGDDRAPIRSVLGVIERVDPWRGRLLVTVVGVGGAVAPGSGYGEARRALRAHDVPVVSDWEDGRFPAVPLGLPEGTGTALAVVVALVGVAGAAWWLGAFGGIVAGLVGGWGVARARDRLVMTEEGLRVGPAWAPWVRWADVAALGVRPAGRSSVVVWARGHAGGGVRVPASLVPAIRARAWRIGRVPMHEATPSVLEQHQGWAAAAVGVPLGLIVVSPVVMATSAPFAWLVALYWVAGAVGALGAAVTARASGWGAGAIGWMVVVYGVVLGAVSYATW